MIYKCICDSHINVNAIHKCKCCHVYLQTDRHAFTSCSPLVNLSAFLCVFLRLSWCSKCILSIVYNSSRSHECKIKGMIDCDHIALHLRSVQLCGLLHYKGHLHTSQITHIRNHDSMGSVYVWTTNIWFCKVLTLVQLRDPCLIIASVY